MDQDVKQLQADVNKLQIELARLEAFRSTTRAWIIAIGALACAWLGVNSLYFVPRMVDEKVAMEVDKEVKKTTEGKAAEAINAKKREAFADASGIKIALSSTKETAVKAQEVLASIKASHFGVIHFDEATVTNYDWWIRVNDEGKELVFGKGANHADAGILFIIRQDGTLLDKGRRRLFSIPN